MNIRRKDNHAIMQSVKELDYPFHQNGKRYRWHNEDAAAGVYHSYSDEEWEEVPVEKWVRASSTLLVPNALRVHHSNGHGHTTLILPSTFRFVRDGLDIFIEEREK